LVLGVVVALSGAGAAWAAQDGGRPETVAPPRVLVLVERLTMDEALEVAGSDRPEVAGFVSTLPVHQPLASRVLSLAAGRRVNALDALEADPAAGSGGPGRAAGGGGPRRALGAARAAHREADPGRHPRGPPGPSPADPGARRPGAGGGRAVHPRRHRPCAAARPRT